VIVPQDKHVECPLKSCFKKETRGLPLSSQIMSGPKQEWKSDSLHGALLFVLFIERIFHPNSYSAAEIFAHPLLPFRIYSKKNFKTYCQTVANRSIKFERYGTGLTTLLKDLVKDARLDFADLIKKLKQDEGFPEYNSESDEDYAVSDSDDITFDLGEDDEVESLSHLVQSSNLGPRSKTSLPAKASKKPSPNKQEAASKPSSPSIPKQKLTNSKTATFNMSTTDQNSPTKTITELPDARLFACWKLESHWDGEIYLSDDCQKIMQDTIYRQADYFSSKILMRQTGVKDNNHVFQNSQQLERDRTHKKFLAKSPPGKGSAALGDVVVPAIVFYLPWPVEKKLFNFNGGEEDSVPIDLLSTGEWAMVVLKKKTEETALARPKIRRRGVRNNGGGTGAGTARARDNDQEAAYTAARAADNANRRAAQNAEDINMPDAHDDPCSHPIPDG
jgi:hypothetical protein